MYCYEDIKENISSVTEVDTFTSKYIVMCAKEYEDARYFLGCNSESISRQIAQGWVHSANESGTIAAVYDRAAGEIIAASCRISELCIPDYDLITQIIEAEL